MKKKPNGYRYFCHLTGCLFGIFILAVLIINFLVPDRGFSQKENRVLASRSGYQRFTAHIRQIC